MFLQYGIRYCIYSYPIQTTDQSQLFRCWSRYLRSLVSYKKKKKKIRFSLNLLLFFLRRANAEPGLGFTSEEVLGGTFLFKTFKTSFVDVFQQKYHYGRSRVETLKSKINSIWTFLRGADSSGVDRIHGYSLGWFRFDFHYSNQRSWTQLKKKKIPYYSPQHSTVLRLRKVRAKISHSMTFTSRFSGP